MNGSKFLKPCTKSIRDVCGCIQHPMDCYIQKTTQSSPLRKLTPEESHLPEYGHNTRQIILDYLYGSPAFQRWQTKIQILNDYIKTRCDGLYTNYKLATLVMDRPGRAAYIAKMRPVFDECKDIFNQFNNLMNMGRIKRPHFFHCEFLRLLRQHGGLITCTKCNKVYVSWKFDEHSC